MHRDTIFALSSGRPPAAIAVIRISGPRAHAAGRQLAGTLPAPRRASPRALRSREGELLDQALVLRFDAPASATGEDLVELHCHGGRAVTAAILSALASVEELREALPGEFTRRAFDNGRIDLTEAEGLADLLEAETEGQRRAALLASGGVIRTLVEGWRHRIVALSAAVEASIDYVGEEETEGLDQQLSGEVRSLAAELRDWLAQPRAEVLKDGVRTVIAGPPNAGKSSLLNALAGDDRAIVTDIAGTTRDRIEVPLSINGLPFVLVDTAGLRDGDDQVEQIGVELAEAEVAGADLLLWLGEPSDAPREQGCLRVHPRCDLLGRGQAPDRALPVSAVTGEGLTSLQHWLVEQARHLLPADDRAVLNKRQAGAIAVAAEALGSPENVDIVLLAERLRIARQAMDEVTGRAGMEDLLDALFGRFCLGK